MSLEEKVKSEIRKNGSITVDRFMEISLFDRDHGYYVKKNPIGPEGDFITSPEISVLFGEILGAFIITRINEKLKNYERINLIELGGGKGTLLNDILDIIIKFPDIYQKISCYILDINEVLVEIQKKKLIKHIDKISWIDSVSEISSNSPHIYISNEFFDALPVKQFIKSGDQINERVIILDKNDNFVYSIMSAKIPQIIANDSEYYDEGAIIEYSEASVKFMEDISGNLLKHKGFAIIMDYGYTDFITGDTIQSVKEHRFNNIFDDIGNADITSHVNFRMLYNTALSAGLRELYIYNQSEFLKSMGIIQRAETLAKKMNETEKIDLFVRINRLINLAQMGELFKFMIAENF